MSLYIEIDTKRRNRPPIILDLHRFMYFLKEESSVIEDCCCSIKAYIDKETFVTLDFREEEERDMIYEKIRELLVIHI